MFADGPSMSFWEMKTLWMCEGPLDSDLVSSGYSDRVVGFGLSFSFFFLVPCLLSCLISLESFDGFLGVCEKSTDSATILLYDDDEDEDLFDSCLILKSSSFLIS